MSNLFVFITISHFKNATCSFFVRVTVLSFAVFLPSASFSCRRGVSRVIYLTLLVMCSHYPWDSSGFLACLSSLYLPLLSLPHSFFKKKNSVYPHTSLPSSLLLQPALEIHCGIDRKTSPVSLWMLGAMYISDQRFLLSPSPNWLKMQHLSRRASMHAFQSLTFTRQTTCITSLLCPSFRRGSRKSDIWASPNTSVCRLIGM